MTFVHMVSMCQNKDKILESLKKSASPVQKVYLILCDNESREEIKDVEKTLRLLLEVNVIDVRQLDIDDIINELLKAINNEIGYGNMVFLNSTDSPEILDFAFHVSAQISGCTLYTGIPTTDGQGIDELLNIPVESFWFDAIVRK